jgi:hypothetical protein
LTIKRTAERISPLGDFLFATPIAPELAEQTKSLENFASPGRARDRSPSNDAAEAP